MRVVSIEKPFPSHCVSLFSPNAQFSGGSSGSCSLFSVAGCTFFYANRGRRTARIGRKNNSFSFVACQGPRGFVPESHKQRALRHAAPLVLVLFVCYVQFFYGNGSFSIMDNTEPKFAVCAKNMLKTGNWLIPHWNGRIRFDKPPLVYWLQALSYSLCGYTEFATRLPTAIAASAVVFMLYRLSASRKIITEHGRPPIDLVSPVAFACSLYAVGWARSGVSDMVLCATVTASLSCFFAAYTADSKAERFAWYMGLFASTALAVLAKGPLGAALPALIINVFLLLVDQWKSVVFYEIPWLVGLVLAASISLPWYLLIIREHGLAYVKAFFGYHNLARLTSAVNAHSGPWYYYLACLFVGFLPWAGVLPAALARVARSFTSDLTWQRAPRREQFVIFVTLWFALTMLFFSCIRTKLFSYILPAIPAAALLIGIYFAQCSTDRQQQPGFVERLFTALGVAGSMAAIGLVCIQLESLIIGSNQGAGDPWILRVCLEQIRAQKLVWRGTVPWLLGGLGVFIVCVQAAWYRYLPAVIAATFIIFQGIFLLPAIRVWDRAHQQPLRELAQSVRTLRERGQPTLSTEQVYMLVFGWCDGLPEGQPSVVWYSDFDGWHFAERPEETLSAIVLNARQDGRAKDVRLSARPAADPAPNYTVIWEQCCGDLKEKDLESAKSVLVLADESIWRTIPFDLHQTEVLDRRGPFVLYRVCPYEALKALQAIRDRGGTLAFQRGRFVATPPGPGSNASANQ
jgi:4-amino-4-deoxy-L-arabinose transferase-like glycosyltransferase